MAPLWRLLCLLSVGHAAGSRLLAAKGATRAVARAGAAEGRVEGRPWYTADVRPSPRPTTLLPRPRRRASSLPRPADLAGVLARFSEMDRSISLLTEQAAQLREKVVQIESLANVTRKNNDDIEVDALQVVNLLSFNMGNVKVLETESLKVLGQVNASSAEVERLADVVARIEQMSTRASSDTRLIAERVTRLQNDVEDLLPGVGAVTQRIADVRSTLQKYSDRAKQGGLDDMVASRITESFQKATDRVDQLAYARRWG
mmetsp:Transcript_32235/g.85144  ORF Transcript_32235/g.85144 Transcript_32235/m.85144 type:complete len:259 (-) Transcript_32235:32-808(-)